MAIMEVYDISSILAQAILPFHKQFKDILSYLATNVGEIKPSWS